MKLLLPRGYLSYSAIALYEKNKPAYREKDYFGASSFSNKETRFGSKIHKLIETEPDHPWIRHIPRFETPEYAIDIEIDGIRVKGQIYSFCSKSGNFRDYKSGHTTSKGEVPWNDLKVRKLDQLPWYAMLLDNLPNNYYTGYRTAYLDWIDTEQYTPKEEFGGVVIQGVDQELRLTGRIKTFPRQIAKYERELQQVRLVTVARQI